jgi:hypothetical protein
MADAPDPTVLAPGLATGIGSLPHADAHVAAGLVLEVHPELPSTPQLPRRSVREQMLAQVAAALPEVEVGGDGGLTVLAGPTGAPTAPAAEAFGGLTAFLELASAGAVPPRVKTQVTGPLTLGTALARAGLAVPQAFRRAGAAVTAVIAAVERLIASRLGAVPVLLVLDEPVLATWSDLGEPMSREEAIDLLSGVLASSRSVTGVHVCGDGDVRLAYEAGPQVLAVPATTHLLGHAGTLARHLDGGGWVAWGAVPTDRPLGEGVDVLWRRLVTLWCELTRRGADPRAVRTQALITPACGLAGHGPTQARRALELTRTLAERVGDQAVATRLTVGA